MARKKREHYPKGTKFVCPHKTCGREYITSLRHEVSMFEVVCEGKYILPNGRQNPPHTSKRMVLADEDS